jgi:hypothetical protein
MSNIYNLQQVSQNSRIVAVEGTFDHIDVNTINYSGDIIIDGVLKVDEIEEKTPGAGISINDKIFIDEINENTLNNGVQFPQKIRVDLIEENTPAANIRIGNIMQIDTISEDTPLAGTSFLSGIKADSINSITSDVINMSDRIRINRIEPKVGNSVEIDEIDVNVLDIGSGTSIRIQQPVAHTLIDEFSDYDITFTNIDNTAFKQPTTLTVNNSGVDTSYLPTQTGVRLQVNEAGIYIITVILKNDDVLAALDDDYQLRIGGSGLDVAETACEVDTNTAIGDFLMTLTTCNFMVSSQFIEFSMKLVEGAALNKGFSGSVTVTRIK